MLTAAVLVLITSTDELIVRYTTAPRCVSFYCSAPGTNCACNSDSTNDA
jgi:hypothetical protein